MKIFLLNSIFSAALLAGCTFSKDSPDAGQDSGNHQNDQAQIVIDRAIKAHGVDLCDHAIIEFDFRGRHYTSNRNGGIFQYERIFQDTVDEKAVRVRDVVNNDAFRRFVDEQQVSVSKKMQRAYSNSVNSVLYFVQQPYFLNDPAVRKEYLGEEVLEQEPYHKVRITFQQEGGGKDYEDIFIYWFHKEKYTMDYFAYYYETEGGGLRFRKAYNFQEVEGIRFADFINYKADFSKYTVEELGELHNQGMLEELSRIENDNIIVKLITSK